MNGLNDLFLIKVFILGPKLKFNHMLFAIVIPKTKQCTKIKRNAKERYSWQVQQTLKQKS